MVSQGRLLGYIVYKEGLKTNPDKVRVMMEMQPSTNVIKVKSFLGHIGYYRRFIKNFAKVSYPLDRLTCKGEPFKWQKEQDESFEGLKVWLATTPILAVPWKYILQYSCTILVVLQFGIIVHQGNHC